ASVAIPDRPFVGTFLFGLPFGRGRKMGSGWGRGLDALLGGGQLTGIFNTQSGQPLTAYHSSPCGSGTNCYGNEKADRVEGQGPNDGPKTLDRWFNTAAFTDRAFF